MTGEMKCPRLYLCLAHSIPSPLMLMQHMHQQPSQNDMIHCISSRNLIGSSILTSLALHQCFSPSAPSLCSSFPATRFITSNPLTCPSRLQPVHQAKPHLDLLHLSHNDSMSCLICNELLHYIFACGLISCVSHISIH